ncbi:Tar ligand binding domain-containing protein [Polynucleobacter sp. JS-JIR-5-A7]|uniref:Tar ligand binding domain-containing protein n=1 Tax=Polynucleobacter sp. JS-JIR-5-A7 TaxID=1758395 RepID=UPI001BFE9734|nr:Tar ligand binding domain-containing protein [Polynucleobacter sp. JS-JIR-5-A7]QWE07401.1 MCP four helix bundle domain-containing protein [Polynucleobacter sp. JS-JIR-5-A7]
MMTLKTGLPKLPYLPVKVGLIGMLLTALLMAGLLLLNTQSWAPEFKISGKSASSTSAKNTTPDSPKDEAPAPVDLNKLKELIAQNRIFLNTAYAEKKAPDPVSEEVRNLADRVTQDLADMNAIWQSYLASPLSAEEKTLATQFTSDFDKLVNQSIKPTVDLLQVNYLSQASALLARTQGMQTQVMADVDALIKAQASTKLIALQKKSVTEVAPSAPSVPVVETSNTSSEASSVKSNAPSSVNGMPTDKLMIITVGMLIMLSLALLISRTLKHSLGASPEELTKAAGYIASGQLDYRITLSAGDHSSAMAAIKAIQGEWKQFMLDTSILNAAMQDGKLLGRRDADQHRGAFYEFAQELNTTIDLAMQKGQVSESAQRSVQQALQKALTQAQAIPAALQNHDLSKRLAVDSELEEVNLLNKTMNQLLDKMEELSSFAKGQGVEIQKLAKELTLYHTSLIKGAEEQAQVLQSSNLKMQSLGDSTKQNAENAKQARLMAVSTSEMANTLTAEVAQSGIPAEKMDSIHKVVERIASSTQYVADMSANITTASLDQSLNLYEVNSAVSQVEKIAQKNVETMKDTVHSGEALLQHANTLAQTFGQLTVSEPQNAPLNTVSPDTPKSPEAEIPPANPAEKDPDWKLF